MWFLVVSAFVLLVLDRGAQPLKGRVALAVSGIALTLACIGLQSWRGSLLETQSLTARVFRPSRSDGRPEGVAAVDTVRLPSRRYINRLAGRRRDVGLVIATFLNVPRAGTYRFELDADDRATLVIDERTVIENAGSLVAEVEASPGGARSAFAPSSSTSHMDGKSEATMGRPHAIASKSLSGEVNKRAVIESKFGITKTLACRFSASSSGGGNEAAKVHALFEAELRGQTLHALEVGLGSQPAHDGELAARHVLHRAHEHIDTLPWYRSTRAPSPAPTSRRSASFGRA